MTQTSRKAGSAHTTMTIVMTVIVFAFVTPLWGEKSVITLNAWGEVMTLYNKDGVWVSEDCLDGQCHALKEPVHDENAISSSNWYGHTAAAFCVMNGGDYIVGNHPNGDQDGVCRFKDNSMIMGWNYYRLFHKRDSE